MKRTEVYDRQTRQTAPIKWLIEGHENYGFAANKRCYNLTTGFEVKQVIKGGYSRGYNLAGQFYSLVRLRPLLYLHFSKSVVKFHQNHNGKERKQAPAHQIFSKNILNF